MAKRVAKAKQLTDLNFEAQSLEIIKITIIMSRDSALSMTTIHILHLFII